MRQIVVAVDEHDFAGRDHALLETLPEDLNVSVVLAACVDVTPLGHARVSARLIDEEHRASDALPALQNGRARNQYAIRQCLRVQRNFGVHSRLDAVLAIGK